MGGSGCGRPFNMCHILVKMGTLAQDLLLFHYFCHFVYIYSIFYVLVGALLNLVKANTCGKFCNVHLSYE